MSTWYNENDPYCVEWLRNLRRESHVPAGEIDERNIKEVKPDDPRETSHFFAGIGGWPLALALAGWPEDRPVWTGSCPCQPFSSAGLRKGVDDPRHLWPDWLRIISERRPPVIFGEQVASKDGRLWLLGIQTDLEALGYAVGRADLCVAGVGAPHIRQRLWWVAVSDGGNPGAERLQRGGQHRQQPQDGGFAGGMGDTKRAGQETSRKGTSIDTARGSTEPASETFWTAHDLIPCGDGKSRRVEPGTFPLAHGVPARVGRLRAYGNAIVPWVAAQFVMAYIEATT